jgi:hypothetical protein
MGTKIELDENGSASMLYDDKIDLRDFGKVKVKRASRIEFDDISQQWYVISARTGRYLKSFTSREDALTWEKQHYCPGGEGWIETEE